jgi:hypothetical protein
LRLWVRQRRVKHRFVTSLPSDLPGALFTATVGSSWDPQERTPRTGVEPWIRSQLRDTAAEITRRYAVDRVDAANDAVQLAIADASWEMASGQVIEVTSFVQLTVDAQSKQLQEQRVTAERQRQLVSEAEAAQLESLQRDCLLNASSARLWALMRYPELATGPQGDVVQGIVDDAEMNASTRSEASSQHEVAAGLIAWLIGDADDSALGRKMLYNYLGMVGEHELREHLHKLGPIPTDETGPTG